MITFSAPLIRYVHMYILLFVLACICIKDGDTERRIIRPRGVSVARSTLYQPSHDNTFTCLNGGQIIDYTSINDDYCDCDDGSDEPGTSACSNGSFHCINKGHIPIQLISTRVNDGVCDCCDGSDEYAHPYVRCQDVCEERGKAARVEAQKRQELYNAGSKIRQDMIARGAQSKADMRDRLARLEEERREAELLKAEKQKIKEEVEARENVALEIYRRAEAEEKERRDRENAEAEKVEAEETFVRFDSNSDGVVEVAELQTRVTFDKNRDGQVSEEEALYFLAESRGLTLLEFVEKAWPLIKPYLMLEKGVFSPPAKGEEEVLPETRRPDEEGEKDPEELDEAPEEEEGAEEDERELDENEEPEENVAQPPEYDEETKRLVEAADDARSTLGSAERAVRDVVAEIDKIRGSLEKDYGPEEEYATLANQCFEYTDREYVYRLCPFDKATQQPKNGGSETRLGNWQEWAGPPESKYSAMMYSQGTGCWNGPNRSTRVNIECGLETQIVAVSEPNRCEYVFEMLTPAACRETEGSNRSGHDEL